MIKETEIAIVNAVSKAVQLMNNEEDILPEKIIQGVMTSLKAQPQVKIQAIAAVNNAIKLKRQNPNLSDKQIVQASVSAHTKKLSENS